MPSGARHRIRLQLLRYLVELNLLGEPRLRRAVTALQPRRWFVRKTASPSKWYEGM